MHLPKRKPRVHLGAGQASFAAAGSLEYQAGRHPADKDKSEKLQ